MSTTRERFEEQWGKKVLRADEPGSGVSVDCIPVRAAIRFAEAEVRRALQPGEAAPELAVAEQRLRDFTAAVFDGNNARAIAAELDRLRAEVARLSATKTLDDCRGFHDAVDEACTCGGRAPDDPKCCPACEVYHAIKHFKVKP